MANEKRLIDANALMDDFRKYMVERYDRDKCVSEENCKTCVNSCLWRKIVGVAPTVDAVEVVHGEWEMGVDEGDYDYGTCSVCGYNEYNAFCCLLPHNYCPNCGAKMDGGNEDA